MERLRCGIGVACGVEPAVGEDVLRREAGDSEDNEREERSMDGHGRDLPNDLPTVNEMAVRASGVICCRDIQNNL